MRKLVLCLLLAACVPSVPPDACGADVRGDLIGLPITLVSGLPPGTRIIRPGDAVTEDFSLERLNIDLDTTDHVTRLWCG